MRMKTMLMLMALPIAVLADGDPKSVVPPLPVEPVVPAATPTSPPPPPVAEAPMPQLGPAMAATPGPVAQGPMHGQGFGSDTRYWVDTQISGVEASTEQRPVPGEVAKRNYDRYLKSFEYPIPETYKREAYTSGTGTSTR